MLTQIELYNPSDYSQQSFQRLVNLANECKASFDELENQYQIDKAVYTLLTAINELEPYFNLVITANNGTVSGVDKMVSSLLVGTTVTLTATSDEGYTFIGWYDTVNNLYFSTSSEYTFTLATNVYLRAVFVKNNSAALTFTTYSNWVKLTVTKTIDEWNEIDSIDAFVPDVPYRYGYSNGRWVYDNNEVLALLRSGENVSLVPEYDQNEEEMQLPDMNESYFSPTLELMYNVDEEAEVCSFVMSVGYPYSYYKVEAIGIALYYKSADVFDPTDFILTLNNKITAGRFNVDDLQDYYIVNMNGFTYDYNWAARGYITYYDEDNQLHTVYSNQINIVKN